MAYAGSDDSSSESQDEHLHDGDDVHNGIAPDTATTIAGALPADHLKLTRAGVFNPSPNDALAARLLLHGLRIGRDGKNLPAELALRIANLADYRTCLASCRHELAHFSANDFWRPGPRADVAGLYLTSPALPRVPGGRKVRAKWVTFQLRGADQGWADFGGHGTFRNSHTWYEASILRRVERAEGDGGDVAEEEEEEEEEEEDDDDDDDVALKTTLTVHRQSVEDFGPALEGFGWRLVKNSDKVAWRVHNNVTARSELGYYRVDWVAGVPTQVDDPLAMGDGAGFLEAMRAGDRIALWARAEQQAWVNTTAEATIELAYEVV
ncbi:hypothetical protein B0T26DRAFT_675767 [Lasiosphaeria miniovina]|uniref:Uncharacterized protein n=1 Tax=Lasiosphaeria miniovina TaxID=1954250 RepID=A0AA40AKD3_9PEZI|nr:uncharacterized protein B0T26DRAFT_675767 [Lasiosphaeria miniovina]KAK0717467.1 hypothetical protein B0T26DRAFT_675767 [Lasiosphaeria miniovina]